VWRLTGLLLFLALRSQPLPAQTFVTLPYFNLSRTQSIDWIGDSFSEAVFEALSADGRLTVSREIRDASLKEMNVRRYAALTRGSVIEIAVNLSADVVIYGEMSLIPDPAGIAKSRLRTVTRILFLRPMKNGPEIAESGPVEDLAALQNRIAWRVLSATGGSPKIEEEFLRSRASVRLDAQESYIRGLLAGSADQKLRLFSAAARLEPAFSQACFQLGRLYDARRDWKAASEWMARVGPSDPGYREALFRLGSARYRRGEYGAAIQPLAKLAAVIPLAEVFNNLGAAQLRAGDAAAAESFRKALEADPSDPDYHFNLGYAEWRRGDFAAAATYLQAALARDPDDGHAELLLEKCEKRVGPRPGDPRTEGLERLKSNYDETAWLHLKAMLERKAATPE
jgi:tetratricopeptide (TPR) repeat protein